jgi:hypothetical protein
MSDSHLAMFLCSGWLASILVGVTIDLWRIRRRQRLALAAEADVEDPGRRSAGASSHHAPAARPRKRPADAAAFDSFDGVPHSPAG